MGIYSKKLIQYAYDAAQNLTALVFPPRCFGCSKLLAPEQHWCSDCWNGLSNALGRQYCPTCAVSLGPHQSITSKGRCANCKGKSFPITGICRLGAYETTLMSAITQFKYNGFINTGAILSEMLAQVLLDQDWLEKIDAFCPVPIHWTRRLTRSFNQAKIISEKLSDITHIPQIDLLSRIRPTPKQVGLNPAQRAKNIQGAFRASSHWSLKNTCICLVDDVMTTGSTLYEAASTLKNAGANTIYAAILAKAEQTNM